MPLPVWVAAIHGLVLLLMLQLVAKCQQEHIPIQTSWEDWPDQPSAGPL